jgi:tRNA A37 threonylcarbamoyladenosine modification protein TsaB
MGAMGNIPVYTLSSLQLASGGLDNCLVLMDARSKRAYYGLIDKGNIVEQGVDLIEAIEAKQFSPSYYACDATLISKEETSVSLAQSFMTLRNQWELVENIHSLAPEYLKSNDDYLVKK